MILSGESLRSDIAMALQRALPQARLLNLYGATETGGDATAHEILDAEAERDIVGLPLPGSRVTPVDSRHNACPVGVIGELLVSGTCLADGYVGWAARSSLEHGRWINDPFGRRAWRTGDIGYLRDDGRIVVQGRIDRQIKIRGVRVEPAEIEATLERFDQVRRVVVRLVAHGGLVAIVEGPNSIRASDLRTYAAARLPQVMVPNHFVVVNVIPSTRSGKLDVSDLLARVGNMSHELTPPVTRMERLVAEVMAEVFPDCDIGLETNFFEVGGHSLKAGALAARLRTRLGETVPLRTIFRFPRLGDLAAELVRITGNVERDK